MPMLSANRNISPAELVDVAFYEAELVLDTASLSKIHEGKVTPPETVN